VMCGDVMMRRDATCRRDGRRATTGERCLVVHASEYTHVSIVTVVFTPCVCVCVYGVVCDDASMIDGRGVGFRMGMGDSEACDS